jgi:hypothetical protein
MCSCIVVGRNFIERAVAKVAYGVAHTCVNIRILDGVFLHIIEIYGSAVRCTDLFDTL